MKKTNIFLSSFFIESITSIIFTTKNSQQLEEKRQNTKLAKFLEKRIFKLSNNFTTNLQYLL